MTEFFEDGGLQGQGSIMFASFQQPPCEHCEKLDELLARFDRLEPLIAFAEQMLQKKSKLSKVFMP